MNKIEATQLIVKELEHYRNKSYAQLVQIINDKKVLDDCITTSSGVKYGFEIDVFWDDKHKGNIRVVGLIDDGGFWRRIFPLSKDFIKSPSEEFIGE